jgi:hypothetical protein
MQRKYRLLREAAYDDGLRTFDRLANEPGFRDFVCLYIAEGYKRSRNRVALGNSDPAVVKLADRWIRGLARRSPRYSVQYHADQEVHAVQQFWGGHLGVGPSSILLQRKSNSNQLSGRTWRSEHGVLTIAASDTLLRSRLQAWMDRLRASWV